MIIIALDGSEDLLPNKKLIDLVGKEIVSFREELLKLKPVSSLKELKKQITPPEGVRRDINVINTDDPLPDEDNELYDGDGEDLKESILEENNGSDRDG